MHTYIYMRYTERSLMVLVKELAIAVLSLFLLGVAIVLTAIIVVLVKELIKFIIGR